VGRRRDGRHAHKAARTPLSPELRWLVLGTFVNAAGTFVLPFLALYLTRVAHLSVAHIGVVLAMFGVGSITAAVIAGRVADRVGHRRTAMAATALTAAVTLVVGWLAALPALLVAIAVYGFAVNAVNPPRQALVAELTTGGVRPRAYAWLAWARGVGAVAAPLLGGILASGSFPTLFLADAATTLALGLIIALRIPEPRAAVKGSTERAARRERLPRELIAVVALNGVFALVLMQQTATFPLLIARAGLTPAVYGLAMATAAAVVVTLQVPAGVLLSRHDPDRTVAASTLLAGAGAAAACAASSTAGFVVAAALWSLGDIGREPFIPTRVAALAPAGAQGRAQGALQLSYSISRLLGPALGTIALAAGGPTSLAFGCVGAAVLAAVGQLAIPRAQPNNAGLPS
jgi:MFS family permease